jgi:hypothetical protein
MFASVRRYRLVDGSMDDLARRVDEDFVEQLMVQPGFVSYELLDCGDGHLITVSVFRDAEGARRSRMLAQLWASQNLEDLAFTPLDAVQGEILVSRAAERVLELDHPGGAAGKYASLRRYGMASGSVAELMRSVDDVFAEAIADLDGFVAYQVLDAGGGEILSLTVVRDQALTRESDEMALRFVTERLTRFGLRRTEAVSGRVLVSRTMGEMLQPTHA